MFNHSILILCDRSIRVLSSVIFLALFMLNYAEKDVAAYFIVMAVLFLNQGLAHLGSKSFIIRNFALNLNSERRTNFYINVSMGTLSIGSLIFIILGATWIAEHYSFSWFFYVAFFCVPFLTMFETFRYLSEARQDFGKLAVNDIVFTVLYLVLKLYLILNVNSNFETLLPILVIEAPLRNFALYHYRVKKYQFFRNILLGYKYLRHNRKILIPVALSSSVSILNMRLDQLFLASFAVDPVEIASYGLASRLTDLVLIVPASLSALIIPRISILSKDQWQIYEIRMRNRLRNYIVLYWFILLVVCMTIYNVIVSDYSKVVIIFLLLNLSITPYLLSLITNNFVYMLNDTRILAYSSVGSLITNILLNYFLIPGFGSYGAAFATVLAGFVSVFPIRYYVIRSLKK